MNLSIKKPITIYSFNKLNDKLSNLRIKEQSIVEQISIAQKQGDLSENFAYHEAKRVRGRITNEINTIASLIASTTATKLPENPSVVCFGALVKLKSEEKVFEYLILNDYEAEPSAGSIGIGSAMFKAMVGKSIGDEFFLITQGPKKRYEIVSISSADDDYKKRISRMILDEDNGLVDLS